MRVWIALLGALLLASLAGNAWLARGLARQYVARQELRLDPLGSDRLSPAPDAASLRDARRAVVMFGDSRARSWKELPELPGFRFVNRGVGGETSAQAAARFQRHVASLRPDVVVVQVGVNELKLVGLLPERRSGIVADCLANLREIVDSARALGAVAVVTTVVPLGEVPWALRPFFPPAEISAAIDEVNRGIRSLAGDGVVVLDAAAILVDPSGRLAEPYRKDWLHVSPAGYQVLNRELDGLLQQLGGAS